MTPEQILEKHSHLIQNEFKFYLEYDVLYAMKEYAKQERDKALDFASKKVSTWTEARNSILSGKTHKDLEI